MGLSTSPNIRRHSTLQKRASFQDVHDLQPGPKLVLHAVSVPLSAFVDHATSSSSSSNTIATTSTHASPTTSSSTQPTVIPTSSPTPVAKTSTPPLATTTSTSTSTQSVIHAALSTSTTSASTSISSSSHLSSTSTVSSGGTTLIAGPFVVPTTYNSYITPTFSATTSSVSVTSPSTTAAPPKSFLSNPGELAATFTTVGIVGLALLIAAVSFLIKRRRRNRANEDDEFFEKILAPQQYDRSSITGSKGLASLDPVHTAGTTSRAKDMYNTYDGDYGYTTQNYGLEYPPETSYTHQQPQNVYYTPRARSLNSQVASHHPFADSFGPRVPGRAPLVHVSGPHDNPFESEDPFHGA